MEIVQIKDDVMRLRDRALEVGFNEVQFKKEASFALQIWNDPKNSYLRNATKASFLQSVLNISQVGLTLNPVSKEAYIIPRYDGKTKSVIACLQPSYIGLVKLITDTGSVKSIQTNLVYDGDDISIDISSDNPVSNHVPYVITGRPKGNIKFVYSIATLADGTKQIEYMSKADIDEIRDTSESYKSFKDGKAKSSIWVTWEGEMCRKTVLRRFAKYLPRTENNKLDNAIKLDVQEYEASFSQIGQIESLLQTANILESEKINIERSLPSFNHVQAKKCIEYLNDNQRDAIESGDNYSAADINRKLDQVMNDENK